MDFSKSRCPECERSMEIERTICRSCGLTLQGAFEISPLASLSPEDQLFVIAFVRHHGSLKKMEGLFGISYPTVKNRLNSISASLDRTFEPSETSLEILERLERGEISVQAALDRLGR